MNRNITIVIIILILVVIAGYLVWLRNQYQAPAASTSVMQVEPTEKPSTVPMQIEASPSAVGSPSATPKSSAKPSPKQKTASPSAAQ